MFLTTEFTEDRMKTLKRGKADAENRRTGESENNTNKVLSFAPARRLADSPIPVRLCALCGLFLLFALLVTGCASTGYVESIKSDVDIERLNDRKEMTELKTSVDNLSHDIALLKEQSVSALKEG